MTQQHSKIQTKITIKNNISIDCVNVYVLRKISKIFILYSEWAFARHLRYIVSTVKHFFIICFL